MTALGSGFLVRVCMLSDWIVGTGEGRVGDVDATVRRGHDGLPFVPAKTLTGIWRDACEQVVKLLATAGTPNPWQAWLDWIFGSQPDAPGDSAARARLEPQRAQLALSPARLSGPVRAACENRPALLAAAVVVRPGVKIDDQAGVAVEDMLRAEERARPGWLESRADFPFLTDPELPVPAEFLLRAGAAVVDALGGRRNRGAGRCWILPPGVGDQAEPIENGEAAEFPVPAAARPADHRLAELTADTNLLDDPGPPPAFGFLAPKLAPYASQAPGHGDGQREQAQGRVTWQVTLEVITPLVAQDRVLGNVALSRDWLPGTVLLPVILSRLSRRVGHKEFVVSDARPALSRDGDASAVVTPGSPAPMVWFRPKQQRWGRLVNASFHRPEPAERLSPVRSGHVAPVGDGIWTLLAPEFAVSTHAVIGDDTGRPDSARGGVFSYLGIVSGTTLTFDVVLPDDVTLALAEGEVLRLGRSRKDDFGQASVTGVRLLPARQAREVRAGEQVRVWCVSDVLLRDAWGAFDPSPRALAAELSSRLGAGFEVAGQRPGKPAAQAYRAARRESFHTRWNRPRPSLTSLAAGSVLTLAAAAGIQATALAEVERDGVGERTAEGFGQVRFGAPELDAPSPVLIPPSAAARAATTPERPDAGNELPAVPHILELAAVKAEIARRVASLLTSAHGIDGVIPGASQVNSRTQWGVLREQLPGLGSPAGRKSAERWLAQTARPPGTAPCSASTASTCGR